VYGSDLVNFLSQQGKTNPESLAQELLTAKFLISESGSSQLAPSTLYTLVHIKGGEALNTREVANCVKKNADHVAEDIRFDKINTQSIMLKLSHFRNIVSRLFSSFVSVDGKTVDYQGIATSPLWPQYKQMATQLQRVDVERLSRDERLAFFINIYNIICIHGLIEKGVPSNLLARFQ
jgi:hypothetical protein